MSARLVYARAGIDKSIGTTGGDEDSAHNYRNLRDSIIANEFFPVI